MKYKNIPGNQIYQGDQQDPGVLCLLEVLFHHGDHAHLGDRGIPNKTEKKVNLCQFVQQLPELQVAQQVQVVLEVLYHQRNLEVPLFPALQDYLDHPVTKRLT